MKAYARLRILVLSLFSILAVSIPAGARAQAERAVVNADSLPVYASTSADDEVVLTLSRGTGVLITFAVTTSDGSWCGISDIASARKLGYVRCGGLAEQNAPNAVASDSSAAVSARADSGFGNITPSRAQKNWAIAASAVLASFDGERVDTLSTGDSVIRVRHLLQEAWGISDHDDLLRTLDLIDQGGSRRLFSALGERIASLSPVELAVDTSRLDSEDANKVAITDRYYKELGARSITAWDYSRYIMLCRWGVTAGYIPEEEAWPRMMYAAQILQRTFTSWSEIGENYLVGRQFWSLSQTRIDGEQMRAAYQKLLDNPGSPWNRIPWNLSLQPPASAAQKPGDVLSGGPSANAPPAGGSCEALRNAAAAGEISGAEAVLRANPKLVQCRDSSGWTALYYAANHGQAEMIRFLVAHGAAVNIADKDGDTPLHAAASWGDPAAIDALLKSGARIDAEDRNGYTPLYDAVQAASTPATEALLEDHASTEIRRKDNGYTPLHSAAEGGYTDIARLLLAHGANIEARDRAGYTPLNLAAWFGQTDMASLLLESNANVNTRSNDGETPLTGAARKGSVEITTLLLEHGARVNARNLLGFTALDMAAEQDQAAVAEVLIENGADINARTNDGDTPLHWAAYYGSMNTAALLIEKGAEIDASDKDGNTPLHWAAAFGSVDMTQLLITNGANMKAKTRFGCTPLRGARDRHREDTAQVLLEHGATQ